MPCKGWVDLKFRLFSPESELSVPFLVTDKIIGTPLVGYNVIEEISRGKNDHEWLQCQVADSLHSLTLPQMTPRYLSISSRRPKKQNSVPSKPPKGAWPYLRESQWRSLVGSTLVQSRGGYPFYLSQNQQHPGLWGWRLRRACWQLTEGNPVRWISKW